MACWVLWVEMWRRDIRGMSLCRKARWWDIISLRLGGHHGLAVLVSSIELVEWSAHIAALIVPGIAIIQVGVSSTRSPPRPKPLP